MPPAVRAADVAAQTTTRAAAKRTDQLASLEAAQLARLSSKGSGKRGTLVVSQVATIGHGAVNYAANPVYAGEIALLEGATYPTGTAKGYIEEMGRGVYKCSRLNVVTRAPYEKSYVFPTQAFVNTLLGVPPHEIGHAEIIYDVDDDRPVFELDDRAGSSLRACGAAAEFERRYGGEANKAKNPYFSELLEIVALKNGVPLDDPSHITMPPDLDAALRRALKARAAARAARAPAPAPKTPVYFFKRDARFNSDTKAHGSATDQFNKLPPAIKREFESLALVAKHREYVRDLEDGEAETESEGEDEAPAQDPS